MLGIIYIHIIHIYIYMCMYIYIYLSLSVSLYAIFLLVHHSWAVFFSLTSWCDSCSSRPQRSAIMALWTARTRIEGPGVKKSTADGLKRASFSTLGCWFRISCGVLKSSIPTPIIPNQLVICWRIHRGARPSLIILAWIQITVKRIWDGDLTWPIFLYLWDGWSHDTITIIIIIIIFRKLSWSHCLLAIIGHIGHHWPRARLLPLSLQFHGGAYVQKPKDILDGSGQLTWVKPAQPICIYIYTQIDRIRQDKIR